MKQGTIEKSAQGVTPEALELIGRYTRRAMKPEELYLFSMVLCDNEIDRDGERFSVGALEKLAGLFEGRTGIFDHDPRGRNQTARIFRCRVERDPHRTTSAGEGYVCLRAEAYMVRSAGNADLILEIDGGIKKEVSVGCSVAKAVCSVCGADRRVSPCPHRPGEVYRESGPIPCHTVLEDPTDAYEWSFVAVPSQRGAGVTKGADAGARSLEPAEAVEAMKSGGLHLTRASALRLAGYIGRMEQEAALGRAARERDAEEIVRLTLLCDRTASPEITRKAIAALSGEETASLLDACRRKAAALRPLRVQTCPQDAPNKEDAGNAGFRI